MLHKNENVDIVIVLAKYNLLPLRRDRESVCMSVGGA